MRLRPVLLIAIAGLAAATPVLADPPTYSNPLPPDRAALARLNLTTDWIAHVPLVGRNDAVAQVQVVDENQIFVQTRAGMLTAIDARTGARQWTARYPAGGVNLYPVAVNERFVFAVNVTRLLCYHRGTGMLEFDYEIKLANEQSAAPTEGPAADRENVYVILNGSLVASYRIPSVFRAAGPQSQEEKNAARLAASQYPAPYAGPRLTEDVFDRPFIPKESFSMTTGTAQNPTPSIAALPRVAPPYSLDYRSVYATPSIYVVPSMRQPYQLVPDYMRFNQRTPSVSTIPPSVARAFEMANLRASAYGPTMEWLHRSNERIATTPLRVVGYLGSTVTPAPNTPNRLWLTTQGMSAQALSPSDGAIQTSAEFRDRISSPIGGAFVIDRTGKRQFLRPDDLAVLGFVGLIDGTLIAFDMGSGGKLGPTEASPVRVEWRTNLGGLLHRTPLVTSDAVYASGYLTGVVRVNPLSGEVVWRSEVIADQLLAVNEEFAYIRDRFGNLSVYDTRKPTDPSVLRSTPLAKIDLSGFNVPVYNHVSDRVFLTADGGMLVCLRDASPKYVRPMRIGMPAQRSVEPPKEAPPMGNPDEGLPPNK
jgi:outer membrane protein assembly factor BamB